MKKPAKVANAEPQATRAQRIWQQLNAWLIFPALGGYALYLATDYLPLLKLRGWPDFASVSLLKANFTGSALLFFHSPGGWAECCVVKPSMEVMKIAC